MPWLASGALRAETEMVVVRNGAGRLFRVSAGRLIAFVARIRIILRRGLIGGMVMRGRLGLNMAKAQPVFDDVIVSATMLNRRPGEVLDQALVRSVTIMRNEQAFALLRREQAAEMMALLRGAQEVLDLFYAIDRVRSAAVLDPSNEFEWITAFGPDDLKKMGDELYVAYAKVRKGELPLDELDAVIHEWHESAWAIRSSDVRTAFAAAADEVPLTEPILEPATQE